MISFAKKKARRVFLLGNNSLHIRWLGLANGHQAEDWERAINPHTANILLCEGPWTSARSFLLRELLAYTQAPKLLIIAGAVTLPEQTILEGLLDHVDIFLPEGLEQFWRGDIQEMMNNFLGEEPSFQEGALK